MTTNDKLADALRKAVSFINGFDGVDCEETQAVVTSILHGARAALAALAASLAAPPAQGEWQPIETAPKDNKRPLFLAHFNEAGQLTEFDWNASWESESESWEIPQTYYYWASENGSVEEPTHWMYQPDWFASAAPHPAPAPVQAVCNRNCDCVGECKAGLQPSRIRR
jgi:hypothetical protein